MTRRLGSAAAVAVAAVIAAGCADGVTQLVVVVNTNLTVPGELDRVEIRVVGPDGQMDSRTAEVATLVPPFPVTLTLRSDGAGGDLEVIAEGFLDGIPQVRRRVTTSFVVGESRQLHIILYRGCIGAVCGADQSCGTADGSCIADARRGEELEPFAGAPPTFDGGPRPADIPDPETPVDMSTGGTHACIADQAMNVFCWGDNSSGQLGVAAGGVRALPVWVSGAEGALGVAAGDFHSCARRMDGTAVCWGRGMGGELGNGVPTNSHVPLNVVGASGVTRIVAGAGHTCTLGAGGAIECWGRNEAGQLGNGTTEMASTPARVAMPAGSSISAGRAHTCARDTGGTIWCWGANDRGQLGTGDTRESAVPVMAAIGTASILGVGSEHTCAGDASAIQCWGFDGPEGRLGAGPRGTPDSPDPVVVLGLPPGITELNAGDGHTCARRDSGGILCWGRNDVGQLGDGTMDDRNQAVESMARNAAEVDAGGTFTCVRRAVMGLVSCWGANVSGQLGIGETGDPMPTPVDVMLMR